MSPIRLPLRVISAIHKNAGSVERVQFVQPTRPKARLFLLIFCATGLFSLYKFSKEAKEGQGKQRNSVFIPFPGTTRGKKLQEYHPSDPEWQAFDKLRKSPKRIKEVCDDMERVITKVANKKPYLIKYGRMRLVASTIWLDFPLYKPLEFERSGIEIADGHISWTTKPVHSLVAFRIQQTLWPYAAAKSLWRIFIKLIKQEKVIIRDRIGMLYRTVDAQMDQESRRHENLAFAKSNRAETPKSAWTLCPRGSFVISGLFQLESEKMWIIVDAQFAWNPKKRRFYRLRRYDVIRFQPKLMSTSRSSYNKYIKPRK